MILQALTGLANGMILFLAASGLTLVFSTLKILNFAHGSFYMLGAYFCYSLCLFFGHNTFSFFLVLLIAPIGVACVGLLVEVFLLRPIYKREHLFQILLTYGLILVFADLIRLVWGIDFHAVPRPQVLSGCISLFSTPVPAYFVLIFVVSLCVAIGLWIFLRKTRLGTLTRAAADDSEIGHALGIPVSRIYTLVFSVGCWLAGLSGAMIAPMGTISLGMDMQLLLSTFIIIVIGGMGSIPGAFIGAIILGQLSSFGVIFVPRWIMVIPYCFMVIVLLLRPWGLMGEPED